jgi:hypothetical protein
MLGMGITRGFESTSAAGPHAYVSQLGLRNGVGRIDGGAAAAKADAIFERSNTCCGEWRRRSQG